MTPGDTNVSKTGSHVSDATPVSDRVGEQVKLYLLPQLGSAGVELLPRYFSYQRLVSNPSGSCCAFSAINWGSSGYMVVS